MAQQYDDVHAAFLWQHVGITVSNIRPAPRQHRGNVVFCGYADFNIWLFDAPAAQAIPLLSLHGNSIKLMGDNLHFDPKSEAGRDSRKGQYFPHWRPLTSAAREVLNRKLADIPEIQELVRRAKAQLA